MAGIDKIIGHITAQAEAEAAKVRAEAEEKAERIRKKAESDAENLAAAAAEEAERETALVAQRYESMADTKKKQSFLSFKQSMITDCIEKAKQTLLAQGPEEGFAMMEKLIGSRILPKAGTLFLSEKDRKAMPSGFAEKVAALAKEKGGSLTVSEEPRNIDGGFVLSYGGIEENCSIGALFEERAEQLSDLVGKLLFS